mmetsp:Transcript_95528/g.239402  ORF Transcript_95528/g.239402 Transcript_95528/m.239402 type:complete len:200 (+) Transcript_95528:330-929(+)
MDRISAMSCSCMPMMMSNMSSAPSSRSRPAASNTDQRNSITGSPRRSLPMLQCTRYRSTSRALRVLPVATSACHSVSRCCTPEVDRHSMEARNISPALSMSPCCARKKRSKVAGLRTPHGTPWRTSWSRSTSSLSFLSSTKPVASEITKRHSKASQEAGAAASASAFVHLCSKLAKLSTPRLACSKTSMAPGVLRSHPL